MDRPVEDSRSSAAARFRRWLAQQPNELQKKYQEMSSEEKVATRKRWAEQQQLQQLQQQQQQQQQQQ